mgnify:CR=1 FL=1
MYTIVDIRETGESFEGQAAFNYLIENEAGEQRWLEDCILLDIEVFTDEDWDELVDELA